MPRISTLNTNMRKNTQLLSQSADHIKQSGEYAENLDSITPEETSKAKDDQGIEMQILNKPASKNDKETEALESPTLGPSPQKSKPSEEPEKVENPPASQKEEQKPQEE